MLKRLLHLLFAIAIVGNIQNAYFEQGTPQMNVQVTFIGPDVTGFFQTAIVKVSINGVTNLSQLSASVAAGIRTFATNAGFTIPANNVLIPSFTPS